ncbi:MAG: NADH-quinone oxidoreductase subunit J [Bacteroidetes bacterium]|nr:NADH-quinone oxidoreductase subunit J [Bacteroidota bacterium]
MGLYDIIFYLFALVTVSSAVVVVSAKNIIYSAFSLLFTLFGVAGMYVLLGSDFIAIVQLMVYVGGILILLIFGVMLTNKVTNVEIKSGSIQLLPALIGVVVLAVLLIMLMTNTNWHIQPGVIPQTTTKELGKLLLTDYVLVFELLGILLLIALVGAASIARREE